MEKEFEVLMDLTRAGQIHITDIDDPHSIDWRVIKSSVKMTNGILTWR